MKTQLFKTSIFAMFVCAWTLSPVSAQTSPNNFSLGVKGGIQGSAFTEFALNGNQVTGFNTGLTSVFSNREHWAFGADLTFSRMGGEYFYATPNNENIWRRRIYADYFRLTPKAYYFFRDLDKAFRPKLMAGLSGGLLVDADAVSSSTSYDSDFKKGDLGILVGGGCNYAIAEAVWLSLDLEYMWGVTSINKTAVYQPEKLMNNTMSLSLGLSFGLSKLTPKK